MKRIHAITAVLCLLFAVSCGPEDLPQSGGMPSILESHVESITAGSAMLSASVSDGSLIDECGFYVYQTGTTVCLVFTTECKDDSFTVIANGLLTDTGYEFEAFAGNGKGLTIKSQRHPFTTLEADPNLPSYAFSFETFLLREFDTNRDGTLSAEEALSVRNMTVPTDSIPGINRLERFQNLDTLVCRPHRMTYKSLLKELDLNGNPGMRYLDAVRNDMETITFPKGSELRHVNIGFNNFTTLDLSTLLKTEYVNVTGCHRLQTIYLSKGQQIEITGNTSANIIYHE